jgi:hypothetical protein
MYYHLKGEYIKIPDLVVEDCVISLPFPAVSFSHIKGKYHNIPYPLSSLARSSLSLKGRVQQYS